MSISAESKSATLLLVAPTSTTAIPRGPLAHMQTSPSPAMLARNVASTKVSMDLVSRRM
jgi:hypothetical protein